MDGSQAGVSDGKIFASQKEVKSVTVNPMPRTLEAVAHDILEMPPAQRLALARLILDLEGGEGDPDAEAAWEKEIAARMKALREGRLETRSFEAFRAEMNERFAR